MNDPRRLLEGDGDELERALLRSAMQDEPDSGSEHAVMFALGLLPPGSGSTPSAASAGSAGAAASAATKLGAWSIAKWIGVGVIAGTATVGGASALRESPVQPPQPVAIAPSATPAAIAAPQPMPLLQEAGASPGPDAQAAPRVVASEKPSATAATDLSLAAEVAALDRANKALESGDPEAALRAIEERNRIHAQGVLQPEAMVVRIEALNKLGRRQQAIELGREFVARYPAHPLREKVRALMSDTDAGSTREGSRP